MSLYKIVGVAIGLILLATLFPIGYNSIIANDTSAWNSAVTTVLTIVLPILAAVGAAMIFFGAESRRGLARNPILVIISVFHKKRRGAMNKIIGIAIGMVLVGILFPVALNDIAGVATTTVTTSNGTATTFTWNSAVNTMFGTLTPILAVVAVALLFLGGYAYSKR